MYYSAYLQHIDKPPSLSSKQLLYGIQFRTSTRRSYTVCGVAKH